MKALRSGVPAMCLAVLCLPAVARTPAEPPPVGFAQPDYIDSAGCAFRRATLGDQIIWAARLTSDGTPLCGLVPSLGALSPSDALVAIPPNRRGTVPAFPAAGAYIQVGAFTGRTRADGFVVALQTSDLSVLRQDFPRRNGRLRVLFVGPFSDDAEIEAALDIVRGLGFTDAFVKGGS